MDIQSSIFNELFVLYPVIIQGWVTPVKPEGIAQGGIPKALYDGQTQGLECLIDPWTEMQLASWTMAADDRVDLFVNDNPTPATGKTVAPGDEQQRVRLYLPHGWLNQGVNRLYYKVTRVGGNEESSRDMLALYHLRLPESLDLIIPPDVVREGVGAELAARGVTFAFTYTNRRHFDSIAFALGDTTVRFDVPDAPAPINLTLFTDTFQRAGDNPNAVAEFRVFDQLGNAVMSGEKRVDIHLGRLSLLAPTVRGMNGNQFSPTTPEIRVLVPQGSLLPTDTLWVNWQGATAVPDGSYPSPPRLVSAGLEIAVPRSVLAYSLSQRVSVSYFIERDGKAVESAVLLLDILPLPATALNSPKIVEADANNFLDITALGTKNATIHALLHTLIEAEQPCWLRLEGKKADGTAHDLTLWAGLPARVNSTWINQGFWPQALANSYLVQLGHGTTLTLKYLVALDKSNIETNAVKFPDRVYTIKSVELVVPTLDRVLDSNGEEVLEGGWTVSTSLTLSGTASKGLEIEVFDDDGSSTITKGRATADPLTGIWTRGITVAEGKHRLFARSLYHGGEVDSGARSFTVTADVAPTIDSVKGSPSGVEIPEGGSTSDTSVTLTGKAANGMKVNILDGLTSIGGPTADPADGVWTMTATFSVGPHEITAEALYGSGQMSAVRKFKVVAALAIDQSVMNLDAVKFVQSYGWGTKEVPGNVLTRQAQGGTPPYMYQSDNPTVASVTSTGKVAGLKNGTTTIRVRDASGAAVSFSVNVKNVYRITKGSTTYSGEAGSIAAQQWIRTQGGLDIVQIYNIWHSATLNANFTNVLGDLLEGIQWGSPLASWMYTYNPYMDAYRSSYVSWSNGITIHTGVLGSPFRALFVVPI
ncbi:Ig-like domain-containing protein [Pseudomonas atacamensis]|uniref:Ig-like domain-containing protein n=1 Tax=Pseudomonas atacamensis TaxID=2565368 RepID=UPI000F068E94|nr:Ig-like domain-containing protein [Pseudomonas atacamensis]UVM02103.1 Ig-like domain-containing protein [Pseudomonas atacamensis]